MKYNKLWVVGDSHAAFYSYMPLCEAWNIGPVTAFNFFTKVNVHKDIRHKCPEGNLLGFCFGEIDCRVHLKGRSIEACLDNYLVGVNLFKDSYKLIVLGPPATTWLSMGLDRTEFPTIGTEIERNKLTEKFTRLLEERCKEEGVLFNSPFKYLINSDYTTKREYYTHDEVHLNEKLAPKIEQLLKEKIGALL